MSHKKVMFKINCGSEGANEGVKGLIRWSCSNHINRMCYSWKQLSVHKLKKLRYLKVAFENMQCFLSLFLSNIVFQGFKNKNLQNHFCVCKSSFACMSCTLLFLACKITRYENSVADRKNVDNLMVS